MEEPSRASLLRAFFAAASLQWWLLEPPERCLAPTTLPPALHPRRLEEVRTLPDAGVRGGQRAGHHGPAWPEIFLEIGLTFPNPLRDGRFGGQEWGSGVRFSRRESQALGSGTPGLVFEVTFFLPFCLMWRAGWGLKHRSPALGPRLAVLWVLAS